MKCAVLCALPMHGWVSCDRDSANLLTLLRTLLLGLYTLSGYPTAIPPPSSFLHETKVKKGIGKMVIKSPCHPSLERLRELDDGEEECRSTLEDTVKGGVSVKIGEALVYFNVVFFCCW